METTRQKDQDDLEYVPIDIPTSEEQQTHRVAYPVGSGQRQRAAPSPPSDRYALIYPYSRSANFSLAFEGGFFML